MIFAAVHTVKAGSHEISGVYDALSSLDGPDARTGDTRDLSSEIIEFAHGGPAQREGIRLAGRIPIIP
jgi:hypothetical protein